jgi:hypothetical protein
MNVAVSQPARAKPITRSLVSKRCLTAQQTEHKSAEEVALLARPHPVTLRPTKYPRARCGCCRGSGSVAYTATRS